MDLIRQRLKAIKASDTKRKKAKIKKTTASNIANSIFISSNDINANEEDTYKSLLEDITSLGLPFYRHRQGSVTYLKSISHIKANYKKHYATMLDTFRLATKYLMDSRCKLAIYRLAVDQFFKFEESFTNNNFMARRILQLGVNSLFSEFIKGESYIRANYYHSNSVNLAINANYDQKLLDEIVAIWTKHKGSIEGEIDYLIKFLTLADKYCQINTELSIRSIFYLLDEVILRDNKFQINRAKFITTNVFWNRILVEVIISFGLYTNKLFLKRLPEESFY